MVVLDRNGELLGAKTANDGQWRFPETDSVPEQFAICLTTFEDKRFYSHVGFDLRAILRATKDNLAANSIVSGGSTITMQTIALSEGGKSRNILFKILEIIKATRLEFAKSKEDILKAYVSNAPFGGNVVGLDAAAWRYFQKDKNLLSWAEYATLAVLPNNPAMIHPGRNREELRNKRNRLLLKLHNLNHFDELSYSLAIEEPLPEAPFPLPSYSPHFLETLFLENDQNPEKIFASSLDMEIQKTCNEIATNYNRFWLDKRVRNLGILVMDTQTGEVLAYVGNGPLANSSQHNQVDMVRAKRSSGSLWKPFLYAMAIDKGMISPHTLIPDIPTIIDGFRPQNFNLDFKGMVAAEDALSSSLNIPFVLLLKDFGLEEFHLRLQKSGITTLFRSAPGYGLPLILGGAETTLLESTALFAYLGRMNGEFVNESSRYNSNSLPVSYSFEKPHVQSEKYWTKTPPFISAGAAYLTLESLSKLVRPDADMTWKNFEIRDKVAWKTGTSFGFKDAWAIGVSPQYTIGVWVGNADGEGRPDVIGVQAAAPLMFALFNRLGNGTWFEKPYDDLKSVDLCAVSGKTPNPYCPIHTSEIPSRVEDLPLCTHHKPIFYNELTGFQGKKGCPNDELYKESIWFTLNPMEAYFYKRYNPEFESIPPFAPDCRMEENMEIMTFRYPNANAEIYLPSNFYGEREKLIFEVNHQRSSSKVQWYLNDSYIGETELEHFLMIQPTEGKHLMTVVDNFGNTTSTTFTIIAPGN